MEQLTGNLQGLSPAQKHMLERIWRRRIDPHSIISSELATFLCECTDKLQRQVGVLIDRKGDIGYVIVGDNHKLILPDLGPRRAGSDRFRGVRLIHTHLKQEPLTRDDYLDLAKLRLDLVAVILMKPDGTLGPLSAAHLLPPNPKNEQWTTLPPISVHELQRSGGLDFLELIQSLEEEWASAVGPVREVNDKSDRAVLVHVEHPRATDSEARIAELKELCRTAGVKVQDVVTQRRPQIDPRWLVGKGKIEELVLRALQADASMLVFDHDLTPAQARSISDETDLKVIDRTMLILDIFAQHAQSRDGKLQVELAQLKYMQPRLHEKNTMMSRLTGGIGGRGPGETKLEINRRRARDKIHQLEKEIEHLGERRGQRRSLRTKSELPVVSIVGYTNAGKSTLLNTLTHGDVLVANKLFATLDPTSRRLRFPSEREIIVTDTVGFIRDLPKELISAFRATLEELDQADLLLHVLDAADSDHAAQIFAVERILEELKLGHKPRLLVLNKSDRLNDDEKYSVRQELPEGILVSALAEDTTRPLLVEMEKILWREERLIDAPPKNQQTPLD